jgi:hypothetical protein
MKQLYTRWGKRLQEDHILEEYPRPLMIRDSYMNLNGMWEYAFTDKFVKPREYDGKILVPFSPESVLSGVGRQLLPDQYLWYRKIFGVDEKFDKNKMKRLLHFGAVDQSCIVYVNGKQVSRHIGGYLPFEADITENLAVGENELILAVRDLSDTSYHSRGKQKLNRGGMFYTAQSGIWKTVWMEDVPLTYIQGIRTEIDFDHGSVKIMVNTTEKTPVKISIQKPKIYLGPISGYEDWEKAGEGYGDLVEAEQTGESNGEIEVELPKISPWTCEEPFLYYFVAETETDLVVSYFAMRIFSVEPDESNIPRICLNHMIQFQKGVLDQGYWSDGLYTAPSDEAFIFDIQSMKDMGFNMIRKHIKIEPQRWYYHCDRLGMVVWQDMVNGGGTYKHWFVTYLATVLSWRNWKVKDVYSRLLSRKEKAGRLEFEVELKKTIACLQGHPSIAAWIVFNEGWGQFQTADMGKAAKDLDYTRLIDEASGWFDQGGGDFQSIHHYFFKLNLKPEIDRATVLSEFGGYSMRVEEHSACLKQYGYGIYKDKATLNDAYSKLDKKIQNLIPQGLCASVYTQLSDVEEEVNGIFTYDREVQKIVTPGLK